MGNTYGSYEMGSVDLRTWNYYLKDINGSFILDKQEMLLPIDSIFRCTYGIFKVIRYKNKLGNVESKYSLITDVICDRIILKK